MATTTHEEAHYVVSLPITIIRSGELYSALGPGQRANMSGPQPTLQGAISDLLMSCCAILEGELPLATTEERTATQTCFIPDSLLFHTVTTNAWVAEDTPLTTQDRLG